MRHIGPVAQDFLATFGVGGDETAISTIDPAGIALATIQELHRRIETQDAALAAQDARIKALEAALQAMARQPQTDRAGNP